MFLAQDKYDSAHTFLQDPAVNIYVQRLAGKFSGAATVRVVRDRAIRAGSFPGGRIYLTSALISRTANEAELAGVLAHEIAHSDSANSVTADAESGLCARFAIAKTPADPTGRARERAADEAAIRMLLSAGYDPAAMVAFFSKLRRADLDLPAAFSAEDLLIERLQLEPRDHPLEGVITNTPEFDRIRARLETPAAR